MADIFISYASEDRERVIPIVKVLEEEGWSTFWDWKSIPVGKTWREVIDEALESARCILVLWSEISTGKRNRWVLEEADYGLEKGKLIPALIDDVRPPRGFGQIQAAKLINWAHDVSHPEYKKLAEALESILGPSPRRVGQSEEAAEAERKRKEEEQRIEREGEIPKPSVPGTATAEAAKAFEPPDRAKAPPRPKSPAAKIGLIVAVAVAVVAGVMLLIRQEEREPIVTTPGSKVPASSTTTAEPPGASKPREPSPSKKFTNSIGMEFVLIPAGSFTMGSGKGFDVERPPHEVKISQSFYFQTTEVTQGQWKKVMGGNPSDFEQCGDDCPVENVSWSDAQRFIEKLNQLEKTEAYRLPSEAEWEYACRAGTTTEFSFGDDAGRLADYAWYSGNSNKATRQIAGKKANSWGLYDMHGNVWEWVEDDWHEDPYDALADGRPWVDNPRGSDRVVRGGSWGSFARFCRSATRLNYRPGFRSFIVGFRLSRSVALGS